ncbi:MAG TPA: hypothetical protein VD927_07455 [Chryseosolibacter sp.]|nr:hypothetical protein [Chryseosolibacter sp.]
MQEDHFELGEAIKKVYSVAPLNNDLAKRVTGRIYHLKTIDRLIVSTVLLVGVTMILYVLLLLLPLLKAATLFLIIALAGFGWLSIKEVMILFRKAELMHRPD